MQNESLSKKDTSFQIKIEVEQTKSGFVAKLALGSYSPWRTKIHKTEREAVNAAIRQLVIIYL